MKHLSILAVAGALVLGAMTNAHALVGSNGAPTIGVHTASTGACVADALLVRPVALGVALVSTGVYVATTPLTFLTDIDEEAGDALFHWPWWFTAGRDLGRFDQPRP